MASHDDHKTEEPKQEDGDNKVTEATVAQPVKGGPSEKALSRMSSADRELVEKALKTQAANRIAPNVLTSLVSSDEHMELRKLYAPETIPIHDGRGRLQKPAERHAFIADGKNLGVYVDRGYVPVVKDNGDLVKTGNGDVLTTLDMGTHKAIQDAIEGENRKHDGKKHVQREAAKVAPASGSGASFSMDVSEQEIGWETKE